MRRECWSLSVCAFLLISPFVPSVLAMPPRDAVVISQSEYDAMARLGINVAKRPVRDPGMRDVRNGPGGVKPLVVGTKRFPVVAIKFPDFTNTNAIAQFDSMLFGVWPSGSAHDYYEEVSYGQFHMVGVVAGWYTSDSNKASYGYSRGFERAAALVKEAARKSDATTNYALYDNDDDGYVDAFTCIHAGMGYEESGSGADIWSHSWDFNSSGVGEYTTNDPWPGHSGQYIKVNDYTTDPERSNYTNHGGMVSIGVFCHEWGHALGLPDLYDTDGGGQGLGNWSCMAAGSWGANGSSPWYPAHMDPWCKMELGWLNPTAVRLRNLYSLSQVETNAKAYWLMGRSRTYKEYFLVENRRKTRFDTLMYNSGLLIYHIDDSVILSRWSSNRVNAGGSGWRYGVALEQADGADHLFSGGNRGDANDPYPGGLGNTTYDSTATTPNSRTNYPSAGTLVTSCLAKNIPSSSPTVSCTLASGAVGQFTGGPDAAGYTWKDSDTAGGPGFYWNDISSGGTLLGYGDDARFSFALPYNFSFYGTSYNTVWVCTNGWLSFGTDPATNEPVNAGIPSASGPNRAVFAFWDDLNVVQSDSGGIYYRNYGTSPNCSTVVMWKHARIKPSADYVLNQATFEVVLYEGGRVAIRSRDVFITDTLRKWGRSATTGIENATGTVGLQYLYNGTPVGNLLSNERAILFTTAPVANRDVGCSRLLLPSGTIDSGTVVTPACSVYNYGDTVATYNVRMRIGAFYNLTAAVTNHSPGTRLYVTFPNWTALQRGTHAVTCSTELAGDANNSNDRRTGTVTVNAYDVGSVTIIAPAGTYDSGAAVTPQARVVNNGSSTVSFPVIFRVGVFYADTQNVVGLPAGATTVVNFDPWSVLQRGTHTATCTTRLNGDGDNSNDRQTRTITVNAYDAACLAIVAPTGTIDSGTTVTPQAQVRNNGTTPVTFPVRFRIGTAYNDSNTVYDLAPGATTTVSFTPWTEQPRGTYAVACTTRLTGDGTPSNNLQTGSVTVRVLDVEAQAITAPAGTVDSGAVVTPQATVRNNGSTVVTFTFRMTISPGGYTNTQTVTNLASGATQSVSFAAWTAGSRGNYVARCTTMLTGDMARFNDTISNTVTVRVRDVGCTRIIVPTGTLDSGVTVTPSCSVYNYGSTTESYVVQFRVGTAYINAVTVSTHAPGTRRYAAFPTWPALQRGTHVVTCTTQLGGDLVQANNRQTGTVTVRVVDAAPTAIVAPSSTVDSGTVVTPQVTVRNNGTAAASFGARLDITGGYVNTQNVTNLGAGASQTLSYPAWTAPGRGSYSVRCTTSLTGDMVRANDVLWGAVEVAVHDIGVVAITSPASVVMPGTVTPQVTVHNFGTLRERARIFFAIRGRTNYLDSIVLPNGVPFADTALAFSNWNAVVGRYVACCTTSLASDQVPENDSAGRAFTVGSPGWSERTQIPPTPSIKPVKDGGWLAYDVSTNFIYASKGNKVGDFYVYDPGAESWLQCAAIPAGKENKMPYKGAAGCCNGNGTVYATKGNNTLGFFRYDFLGDSWHQLADVPAGVSNKKVKGGTDLTYVQVADTPFVYLLKGYRAEFHRYNTLLDSWQTLPDAPTGARAKYDKGSFLVHDGGSLLYAHKAKYHELYAFDLAAGAWLTSPLKGMPFVGRAGRSKKSKDGGCGTWYDGAIYALKGGNSQEFWSYLAAGDSWTELDTIPAVGTSMRKKKVKAGADIVADAGGVIYATKGNKTTEFWRYIAPAMVQGSRAWRSGVMAREVPSAGLRLSIAPNPMRAGFAVLRFSSLASRHSPLAVSIYDPVGRCVQHSTLVIRNSSFTLDLRSLSAGVYLVKLSVGNFTATQKLVVQR